ncbi:PaaI family thioesterase [Sandaracinobacter sp. RS1-74]|uniref:PaaI family thioesterase n=1 Tax=Sandaracinobacteroides sayramensis TaxID=2913411 RepID=UPI001EDAED55|nr:PaaI family thioesterase [Sandaracinobacteroides sayramensis]MCG2839636.1 PaaI family thioesterase [Sandaracinobacteroides sayramensis]
MALTDAELLERMRGRKAPTTALLGLELEAVSQSAGTTRYRMLAKPEFCNPMGNLQGGIITTALDDAAATAVIAKAGRRVGVPTIEFKVSFFAPARLGGSYVFEGRVLKMGRSISFAEADMLDETGKLLARLTTSCVLVEVEGPGLFAGNGAETEA